MKLSTMPPKVKIPAWVETPDLYLPKRDGQTIEARPDGEIMRGLCPRSAGNLAVCKTCRGGCSFGAELLRREAEMAKTQKMIRRRYHANE